MSCGLSAIGHRVTVVCGFGQQPRESTENGIRVLRVIDTSAAEPGVQIRQVLERLRESSAIDIVEFPEYEGLGLEFQRANPEVPVVVKLHGDSEFCRYGGAPAWKRLAHRLYTREQVRQRDARERESARLAHAVVSPSEWLLKEDIRRGWPVGDHAVVVPNPFSGWPVAIDSVPRDYGQPRVLWLARLGRLKGADLLPAIARRVWKAVPEAEFHLIGQQEKRRGQPWTDWIRERVPARDRSKITFLGGLPFLEVARTIPAYSLAAFASTWENFGYTEVECMWAGVACVSASRGGAAELGTDGVSHVRARRTPGAIATALIDLLKDPSRREHIAAAGQARVRDLCNAESVADSMARVYAAACERARSGKAAFA
jgi:glycosyltransferase involved in cell wall biosynthesis